MKINIVNKKSGIKKNLENVTKLQEKIEKEVKFIYVSVNDKCKEIIDTRFYDIKVEF